MGDDIWYEKKQTDNRPEQTISREREREREREIDIDR